MNLHFGVNYRFKGSCAFKAFNTVKFCVWPSVSAGLMPKAGVDWISANITDLIAVALQKSISFLFVEEIEPFV